MTHIAVVLYDGVAALEVAGACEVLGRMPGCHLSTVGGTLAEVAAGGGSLRLVPTHDFKTAPRPAVVVVPGCVDTLPGALADEALLAWLREACGGARWVVGVSEGAVLLAAAGVLEGRRATTHWSAREALARYGVAAVDEPTVTDGPVVTAAGASGAVEAALLVVAEVGGEELARRIQLLIEYDPDLAPPEATHRGADRQTLDGTPRGAQGAPGEEAPPLHIALLVYEGITAMDILGPYDVLWRLPGARVEFVAREAGVLRSDTGALQLVASRPFREVPRPDVIVVPAANFTVAEVVRHEPTLAWLRSAHGSTRYTTSVCGGSLILAEAGVLQGLRATSHWLVLGLLRDRGAEPVMARYVAQGRVLTAAGVSAGVDMALQLAGVLGGAEVSARIRLALQYEPAPPSDAGAIRSAPAERVRRTAGMLLVNRDLPRALRVTPVGAALAFSWRLLRHRLSAGRAWIPGRPTG